MKTVCHLLPGFYPMDCVSMLNTANSLRASASLTVTHNGREGESLVVKNSSVIVCLVTQQVNNFVSYFWLGGTVKVWENQAEPHVWPELVFLQSSAVKVGCGWRSADAWLGKTEHAAGLGQ